MFEGAAVREARRERECAEFWCVGEIVVRDARSSAE